MSESDVYHAYIFLTRKGNVEAGNIRDIWTKIPEGVCSFRGQATRASRLTTSEHSPNKRVHA